MNTEQLRKEFEAWAVKPQSVPNQDYKESFDIEWDEDGNRYYSPLTRMAYDDYQAAAKSRDELIDKPVIVEKIARKLEAEVRRDYPNANVVPSIEHHRLRAEFMLNMVLEALPTPPEKE